MCKILCQPRLFPCQLTVQRTLYTQSSKYVCIYYILNTYCVSKLVLKNKMIALFFLQLAWELFLNRELTWLRMHAWNRSWRLSVGEEADVQESQGETHDFSAENRKDEVSVCVCVHTHIRTCIHASEVFGWGRRRDRNLEQPSPCYLLKYWVNSRKPWIDVSSILMSEKAMAPHSSTLNWRIPGTGEPGGLPFRGRTELDTTEVT